MWSFPSPLSLAHFLPVPQETESWVLIGQMMDKVCFWAALLLFSIGTVAIFLMGHFNQVPEFPFPGENKPYAPP